MIEIAAYRHLAIVPLLAVALVCMLAAVVVLRLAGLRVQRHRLYLRVIVLGVVGALGSGVFWSTRHAGTGTQTTWGWPRMIYRRWVSWETGERQEGVRWQGIAENAAFYGAVGMLAGSLVLAARRQSSRTTSGVTGPDRGAGA